MSLWHPHICLTLAAHDGAAGWARLVAGAKRALADNQALAPTLGVLLLVAAVIVADVVLAGRIERSLRRRKGRPSSRHSAR